MPIHVLDPSNETSPPIGELAPRLNSLAGKTVGFISNGKEGSKGFFRHVERILREDYGVANIEMRVKSNFSAPADPHIAAEIPQWDAVITGLGD
jgi:hypothetical protein